MLWGNALCCILFLMNSKMIGEKSEGMVLARFLQLEWVVLLPFGDNQRYDFVIDRGQGFERIQIKTAKLKGSYIKFHTCSSQNHRGNGVKNYKGQCEFFAAYCPENNKIYFVKVEECGDTAISLRINPPINNQKSKIRFAENYEL